MRATSGCYLQRNERAAACRPQSSSETVIRVSPGGFTLVELLVVLVLLGLLAGLAAPVTLRALEAAQDRAAGRTLVHALSALPMEAFVLGRPLEVDSAALVSRMPDWPQSLKVVVDPPARYGADGIAIGTRVSVIAPDGSTRRWRVEAYTGRVQAETGR